MSEPIGALRAELSANAAQFEADMKRARQAVRSNAAGMEKAMRGVGAQFDGAIASIRRMVSLRGVVGTLAGTAGLGLLAKKALDAADAIAKTADKVGVTTDTLQEYRHVADLSGVSNDKLETSFAKFTRNLGDLARTSSETQTALKDIDPTLLSMLRSTTDVGEALQIAFRQMGQYEDATKKAAVAAALFGRSGIDMVNLLRDGSEWIERTRKEARDLGLVIEESLLRGAEDANDRISTLSRVLKTQFYASLVEIAPIISSISNDLLKASREARAFYDVFQPNRDKGLQGLQERLESLNRALRKEYDQAAMVSKMGGAGAFLDGLFGNDKDRARRIAKIKAEVEEVRYLIAAKKPLPPIQDMGFIADRSSFKMPSLDLSDVKFRVEDIRKSEAAWKAWQKAVGDAGDALTKEMMTPLEAYDARIQEINRLLDEGAISHETYTRAVEKAQDTFLEANRGAQIVGHGFDNMASSITNAMINAGDSMIDFRAIVKGVVADITATLLQLTVFEPIKKAVIGSLFGPTTVASTAGLSDVSGLAAQAAAAGVPRASGGPVSAGVAYPVGERGMEYFVPGVDGTIIPNSKIGSAGGVTVHQSFDFRGADVGVFSRAQQFKEEIKRETINALSGLVNQGGTMAQTLGRRRG